MNVLSVFDGLSCGQIALNRAGIKYDDYFASEIDKYAIKVTQSNYPNTIQLGDITQIKGGDLPKIDLILGGSPCQGFSFAGKGLNFDDPRSKLFFDYVRLLKECKPKYFLLENVIMDQRSNDVISSILGEMYPEYVNQCELFRVGRLEPIRINSALVSAQNRKRLYWTNIPNITQPKDKKIYLADIIENGIADKDKSHCLDVNYFKGGKLKSYFEKHRRQLIFSKDELCHVGSADLKGADCIKRVYHALGKSPTLTTMQGGHREPKILCKDCIGKCIVDDKMQKDDNVVDVDNLTWRRLTPLECERLQTISDGYTDHVSNTQRYRMIGNGWTVDVIAHIFKNINIIKV